VHRPDFDEFRAVLNTLSTTFGKPQLDDVTVQAYWNALKDQTLESVKRQAAHHTRYAKFFPRPVELRPRDERKPLAPGIDDNTNWVRGFWRTQVVHGVSTALGQSFDDFERTLILNQQQLAEPMRRLLDHCEAQERTSGRTDALLAHCRREAVDIGSWFLLHQQEAS
jgi:hypothetical protein